MIIGVQLLRFIAALFVLLTHTLGEYEWSKPFGSFGVDIFFVISGFIIYVITNKDFDHFLIKRLIRIVPMYWLFTFGISAIALLQPSLLRSVSWDLNLIFASLFFVPYFTDGSGFSPILKLGWTLNFEMFFYLIFYLSMMISHKHRAICASAIMITMVVALNIFDFYSRDSFLVFYSRTIWFEFIFGIMIGFFFTYHKSFKLKFKYVSFAVLTSLCIMMSIQFFGIRTYPRFLEFGLPSCVLLIAFLGYENYFANLNTLTKNLIMWLGEMSYPLYLVHIYCIALLHRVLFVDIPFGLLFLTSIFISLLISDVATRVYDKPLRKYLTSIFYRTY